MRSATYQIPDNHPERLAEAIRSIIRDDALSQRLTEKVRQFACEASWPRVAKTYVAQLEEVLQKRRRTSAVQNSAPIQAHFTQ